MADLIGGRYRLIRKLGAGGMGDVYAARDERLERDVAVKLLHSIIGEKEQIDAFAYRFKREAVSMGKFIHPYIVPLYDYGEEDGRLYLVMGLMPGGSLKDRMGKPTPLREAVELLLPICSALAFVHENGLIHRDVKPHNILFSQRGVPMLADFGIVKLIESEGVTLTAAGTGIGTPAYMAPEQVTNDIDHRIDQYALGVILYELLTGKKPFEGDTPVMTLIMHRTEPLPDPRQYVPDLSPAACVLLEKVLAKHREDRFADIEAFAMALQALVANEIISSANEQKTSDEHRQEESAVSGISSEDATRLAEEETKLVQQHVSDQDLPEDQGATVIPDSMEVAAPEVFEPEESQKLVESEETELLPQRPSEADSETELCTEILPAGDKEAREDDATELLPERASAPSSTEMTGKPDRKRMLVWAIPVGLIVLAGLVVGVLALLQVGPFATAALPVVAPTSTSQQQDNAQSGYVAEEGVSPEQLAAKREISFGGSTTAEPLVRHLMERFNVQNPTWELSYRGESSQAGLMFAAAGDVDVGVSTFWFDEQNHEEFPNLIAHHIAYVPGLVMANAAIGVQELNIDQLTGIFSGEIRNWSVVGGPDAEIVVVAAEESSHYQVVYYSIMGDTPFGEDTRWVANTDEVNEIVESTWNAIGITRAYVEPDSVRMLTIEGVACNGETLMRGWYPLLWPVTLVTNDEPGEEEAFFLDWVRAPDSYHAIWEVGFIPLWENHPDYAAEEVALVLKTSSMLFAQTEELSHLFKQSHPGWGFRIEQTGTPAGIQAVMAEEADIAVAVGYFSKEEWAQYPEALDFHVGWVPSFFINRTDLDIGGLSSDDFRHIVAGDIRNWSEVGGPDREIVIGAYAESNAWVLVQYHLLQDWTPYEGIVWLESVEQVVQFVSEEPYALGIIDNTETPENIHWMRINDVDLTGETLMNGDYYLVWPVILVTKGEPDELEWQFIDFLYSEEGKRAFWDNRLVPVP